MALGGGPRRRAVVLPGEAGTPAPGQMGGAAEWNEGDPVDVVGGGEEARFGRNQAEAEAAMEENGGLRRDGAIAQGK